jgi:hypothetical protein
MEELTFQRDETEFHGMGQNGLRAASTYVFYNHQRLDLASVYTIRQ